MGRPKGSKNKSKISEETILEIIKLYKEDRVALYKIEDIFHISRNTLKTILENNNISLRSFRDAKRQYPLNENYFSEIDSIDKAYWLGFMFADGYITQGKNGQFIFGLKLIDKEILELFKKYLQTEKPITSSISGGFSNGNTIYALEISCQQIFNDLSKHGCIEQKTFKLKFPNLKEEFISHFIRGYFDGDGTVHVGYQKEKLHLYSGFSGIKEFLEKLLINLIFIKEDHTILFKDERKETDCYNLKFNSNFDSLQLYHYLYKNCSDLFLKRKKEKFEVFIKDKGSTTIITNPTKQAYLNLCFFED
jgi:uncharacterized protein YdhG (YjbR/CyaY superfamily)/predicted HTH domain antitoxin